MKHFVILGYKLSGLSKIQSFFVKEIFRLHSDNYIFIKIILKIQFSNDYNILVKKLLKNVTQYKLCNIFIVIRKARIQPFLSDAVSVYVKKIKKYFLNTSIEIKNSHFTY